MDPSAHFTRAGHKISHSFYVRVHDDPVTRHQGLNTTVKPTRLQCHFGIRQPGLPCVCPSRPSVAVEKPIITLLEYWPST
jgi:hypothetical protein